MIPATLLLLASVAPPPQRLDEALFARPGYPVDGPDLPLWGGTRHLLAGRSHRDALRRLAGFAERPDHLEALERALLQGHLWAAFDWAAPPQDHIHDFAPDERRALREHLAAALAPLRVDPKALPDTYAAAVRSRRYPTRFDAAKPEGPWLPDDLFDAAGPWVCVGGPGDGPSTPRHARHFGGRSTFLTFLRLPAGRAATLAYLKRLGEVPPLRAGARHLRDGLPQVPEGTAVALVRQLVVLTDAGPAATDVTQSVQLRVIRRVGPGRVPHEQVLKDQAFVEFLLRRDGVLRPLPMGGPETHALEGLTGWNDPVESDRGSGHAMVRRDTCAACHSNPGIYSVNTFNRAANSEFKPGDHTPSLTPSGVGKERERMLKWTAARDDYALLRRLMKR